MVDFKLDKTMPEGEIPFEISGYADEAKNVGEKLNNANINHDQYTKVVYDLTAPEIIVKEESKGTDPYFSNVSFKLHDNYLVKEYEINGKIMKVTPNAWTDANFQNIKQYLVAGENTIIVRDMAGNATTKTFVYDTVAPEYSAMGIFNWTNNKDGEDVKIATKNEHIRLFVAFPELSLIHI